MDQIYKRVPEMFPAFESMPNYSLSRLWKRTLLQLLCLLAIIFPLFIYTRHYPKQFSNILNQMDEITGTSLKNDWVQDELVIVDIGWQECTYWFGFWEKCSISVKYSNQEKLAAKKHKEVEEKLKGSQNRKSKSKSKSTNAKDKRDEDENALVYNAHLHDKDIYLSSSWFKKLSLFVIKVTADQAKEYSIPVIQNVHIFNPLINHEDVGQNAALESHLDKLKLPFKVHKEVAGTSGKGVPLDEINYFGWFDAGYGLWVKKEAKLTSDTLSDVNILFGRQSVDARSSWMSYPNPLSITDLKHTKSRGKFDASRFKDMDLEKIDYHIFDKEAYLFYRPRDIKLPRKEPLLIHNGKFKILQLADIHFSTGYGICSDTYPPWPSLITNNNDHSNENFKDYGPEKHCLADLITLDFINEVLDLEEPDFVVLTGDQLFAENCPDPQTALFKVVAPLIERNIPYAIVWGNHDDEGKLKSTWSREQLTSQVQHLDFCHTVPGPDDVDGFGNFVVVASADEKSINKMSAQYSFSDLEENEEEHSDKEKRGILNSANKKPIVMYFLDSHSYPSGKIRGYDWIKDNQIDFLKQWKMSHNVGNSPDNVDAYQLAFFHIPLQEYVPPQEFKISNHNNEPFFAGETNNKFFGSYKEGVMAGALNTGVYSTLKDMGVNFVSVGHDHCNDYCYKPEDDGVWLCYGGAVGEGGYAGYGGTERRVRVFEIDTERDAVSSWQRFQTNPSLIVQKTDLI